MSLARPNTTQDARRIGFHREPRLRATSPRDLKSQGMERRFLYLFDILDLVRESQIARRPYTS